MYGDISPPICIHCLRHTAIQVKPRMLSWKEPYASLMIKGKIETRTWDTKYRGWVLMCASQKSYDFEQTMAIAGDVQMSRISRIDLVPNNGHAFAIGRLIDSRHMMPSDENACFVKYKEPWTEDREGKNGKARTVSKRLWCHVYANVHAIEPFDIKGAQGWSVLTDEIIEKIQIRP